MSWLVPHTAPRPGAHVNLVLSPQSAPLSIAPTWVHPGITEEAFPLSSVVLFIAAGFGVSLVPAFLAKHLCRRNVAYRLLEGSLGGLQLTLTWRSSETSAAVHAFLDVAREAASTLPSEDQADSNPWRHLGTSAQ